LAEKHQKPVIIIGAGPVGLSLAIALIRKGIQVKVYESLPELNPQTRASTFHPPTLEMFEEWGLIDEILEYGQRVNRIQYWDRSTRELRAEFAFNLIKDFTPYPFRIQFPQHSLIRLIADHIDHSHLGDIYFDHKFLGVEEKDGGVAVTLKTPEGEQVVEGTYLCAADGSRSAVRRHLDIDFAGYDYSDRFLLVTTDMHLEAIYPDLAPVAYFFDPEEWVIVLRLPGHTRLVFQVGEDEDREVIRTNTMLRTRIAGIAPDVSYNFQDVSVYEVQQRVAETFRQGRVLLLGDAAHVTNPIGGTGLNTGIHDAHSLAGRLRAVINGEPDKLLDTYNEKRRRIALDNLAQTAREYYADMSAATTSEIAERDMKYADIALDLKQARDFLLHISMMDERIPDNKR
jgi:3-(3-hydroxy-phenyl)propionate hydroxylase